MKRAPKLLWIVIAILFSAGVLKATLPQVAIGTWTVGADLSQARSNASAVMLSDGRILVAGGDDTSGPLQMAEFFASDGTVSSAAPMNVLRSGHLAVTLSDGRVLVGGGISGGGTTNSAEIYDPSTDSWTQTNSMTSARANATAALLQDGRVLIAGGDNSGTPSNTIEIYDPSTGNFSFAGTLSSPRTKHAMVTMQDGRVLIVGGFDGTNPLASSDIFDPSTGNVSAGPTLTTARYSHSATTLLNGTVMVAGGAGAGTNGGTVDLASAELFDPSTGAFTTAGASLSTARQGHQAFLLPNNNNVLIVGGTTTVTSGGTSTEQAVATSELFMSSVSPQGVWTYSLSSTGSMNAPRAKAAGGAMKQDGVLLAAGGSDASGNALASTELYAFPTLKTDQTDYAPGTTVTITGSGFKAFEPVTLTFGESPLIDTHATLTATADGNGNISNSQFSPDAHDVNVRFYLTAVGTQSGLQAQNTFTDAGSANVNFATSGLPSGTAITATIVSYINNGGQPKTNLAVPFTTPGPSANTGTQPLSSLSYSFPATITVSGTTYNFSSGSPANPLTTGANGVTTTITGTYVPAVVATSTTVATSGSPSTYGSSVTFMATVTRASGSNTPTGTVTIKDGSATVCTTGNLSGSSGTATASCALSTLSVAGSPHSITGVYGGDANFTGSTSSSISQTVNQKALTVTGLTASNKVYDATTAATLSGAAALLSSETIGTGTSADGKPYTGDTVTISGSATGTFANRNVANGVSVTISGLSLAGAQSANYTLTAPTGLTANITAKALTVTGLSASNKVYDATLIATLSGTAVLQAGETAGSGTSSDGKPYSSDTVSVPGTPSGNFATKDVATAINVSVSGLTLGGADAANYIVTAPTLSADITPKVLTYSGLTVPASKVYDGTTAAVVSGTAALQGTEAAGAGTTADGKPYSVDSVSLSGAATGTYNVKDVAAANLVTFAGLSLTGTGNGNYTLTALTQAATITAKALTYSGLTVPASKTYDGTIAAVVGGTAALQATEGAGAGTTADGKPYNLDAVSITGMATGTYNTKDVATASTVTFGGVSLSGTGNGNYTLTALTQAATITAKALDVSGLATNNKIYDATNVAGMTGAAGLMSAEASGTGISSDGKPYTGDAVSLTGTPSGTFASKDVANGIHVSVSGLMLSGGDAGNYSLTAPTLVANITPKALDVTGLSANNKIYDATAAATLLGAPALQSAEAPGAGNTSDGIPYAGDAVSVGGTASGSFASKDVANGIHVSVSGLSLTGGQAGNYTLTAPTLMANITTKALNVTGLMASNKVYDGLTSASLTGTAALLTAEAPGAGNTLDGTPYTGDVVMVNGTPSGAFASQNVANGISVSVSGLSLGGAQQADYNLTAPTLSANITPATLTYTAAPATRTYGASDPPFTGTASGFVSGENQGNATSGTLTFTTNALLHSNIGSYTIDGSGLTANYGNYVFVQAAGNATALTITKADATINVTPYSVTYTGAAHTAAGTAKGVFGENLAGLDLTATAHTNASDYPTDPWTFTDATGNYNNASSTVHDHIDKADATIVVTGYTVTYNGAAHTATGTAKGVLGESLSGLDLTGTTHTNASDYPTDPWTFTDATGNYNNANSTVHDIIDKADATIHVNGYMGVYDGNAHEATGSATGVKGEDLSNLLNLGASFSNVPGGAANWAFAGDTNYKSANGTATITISKADAAISVTPYSVAYDANPHTATGTATGVKGEVLSGLDLSGTTHTSAGTYTDMWMFTDLTGNYNNSNNTVSDVIKKAKATIVVTPYSVTYDGTSHTASGTATGVSGEALNGLDLSGTTHINAGTYNGDPWTFTDATGNYYNASATVNDSIAKGSAIINVTAYNTTYDGNAHTATGTAHGVEIPAPVDLTSLLHLSGTTHTSAGDYASDAWTFDGNNNYNSTSGSVHDAIGKADPVISVTAYNVTYDANPHTAMGTATGVKGETLSGLDLSGTNHTNAGTYNDNWTFTDTTGNYNNASAQVGDVISKAPSVTTITPGSLTVTYDGLSHTVSGMVTGAGGLSQSVAVSYAPGGSTGPVNAGTYTANATYAGDANHFGSNASPVTIAIGKAPLTITADNKTKLLNAPNPALTFSYSSFVNGENQSVLSGTTTCSTTAVTTSPVGSYPITCSGQTSTNYSIAYVQGTLKITYVAGGMCAGDVGHQIRQPINVDGTSVWKQGSTVPAKFAACDANGISIGTAGVVTNFFVYKTVAGTVASVDETNITSTNSLNWNFDPTAQQWIFNIGTKTGAVSSPSTTYYFEIDLNDGSKILFQFGLK